MPVQVEDLNFLLDINDPNTSLKGPFYQGNAVKNLNFRLTNAQQSIALADTVKPVVFLFYYDAGMSVAHKVVIAPFIVNNLSADPLTALEQLINGTPDAVANAQYKVAVKDSTITLPANLALPGLPGTLALFGYAGRVDMILAISDGIEYYTYSCTYNVNANKAYENKDFIQNLGHLTSLSAQITALQSEITSVKQSLQVATTSLGSKAEKSLTNVGEFSTAEDGSFFYKDGGILKAAPLKVDKARKIISSLYDIKTIPKTLLLGDTIGVHENGGFLEYSTATTGKNYTLIGYENDPIVGTSKPIWFERGAKERVVMQPIADTTMNDITQLILGIPKFDHQIQSFYIKAAIAINNLKIRVNVNGHDVAYYPSRFAWETSGEVGYNLIPGENIIKIDPFFSHLMEYNTILYLKADDPINLLGNGALPYVAEDLNRITRTPLMVGADGVVNFTELLDVPQAYAGQAGKVLAVKTDENGLEFITPSGGTVDNTHLQFAQTFGVRALNSGTENIEAFRFVLLSPKADSTFAMTKLTKAIGYHGELIGFVRNSVTAGAVGYAELITTIATGASNVAVGQAAYIGFDIDTNLANVQIAAKNQNAVEFGRCGVFGEKNDLGEAYATFNAFQVEAESLINADHQADVAYYDNLPAVIDKKALFVHLVANIVSSGGTIVQNLPTLADVKKGMQIMIENKSASEMSKVTLQAIGADKIDGKQTLDVIGGNIVALVATNNGWIEVYSSKKYNSENLITVGELHGEYHQGDVKEIQFHNGLDVSIDEQNKVASIALFKDAYASTDLSNVLSKNLDQKFRETQTYKTIWSRLPQLKNVMAKYIEKQQALNLNEFNVAEQIIHINYQIVSENQTIQQVLPSTSIGKVLMIQMTYSTGITSGSVVLTAANGEQFNGTSDSYTINKEGMSGVAFAENLNWSWVPYLAMHEVGINVNDQKSNFFIGMQDLAFGAGFTATQDPTNKTTVKIDYDKNSSSGITFLDGLKGTEFTASKIKSADKSIRIANLNGVADFSKGYGDHNEGIHVCLGNDELLNSKYGKAKLYFNDTRVKGGMFVYPDMDTKSFIIQDVDPTDDPNVSGGTTFIIALYYEPNPDEQNIVTQDGQIAIELVDDNDIPITDTEGNPMGSIVDYKAGDKVRPELYIGECRATAFTRVHLKIDLRFANEEIISVGANTQLCIQSITKDESCGLALLSFMAFTGYQFTFDSKYYGYNSLNMAQFLTFDVPEDATGVTQLAFGNNTYLDFKANAKLGIQNNHLVIKDDGVNLPIWSIVKVYDALDSHSIKNLNYKVTATVTDKDNAYRVGLLEYTGTVNPPPIPTVLSYLNQNPVFTNGWVQRDNMFISQDAVIGDHTQSKTFTIPSNPKGLAILMYPESSIPSTLKLKDLEGDITPWFNRLVITDNSHISEKYLISKDGVYRGIVKTPSGYTSYRYTVNSTDTKMPIGVVSGEDTNVINDHSWNEPGSIDPNRVQGDLKFLVDGKVTMSYTARCFNEQGSLNNIEFWLAKNVGGVFTEVVNSRTAATIESQRTKPKMVSSFKFSFDVKANETYRMFAKSNKDDGFYLQSDLDGVPLFRADIEFDEFTTTEKDIFDKTNEIKFVDNGQEVFDKILQYDVGTGKMSVQDK